MVKGVFHESPCALDEERSPGRVLPNDIEGTPSRHGDTAGGIILAVACGILSEGQIEPQVERAPAQRSMR
jgi:hypothetical protein